MSALSCELIRPWYEKETQKTLLQLVMCMQFLNPRLVINGEPELDELDELVGGRTNRPRFEICHLGTKKRIHYNPSWFFLFIIFLDYWFTLYGTV